VRIFDISYSGTQSIVAARTDIARIRHNHTWWSLRTTKDNVYIYGRAHVCASARRLAGCSSEKTAKRTNTGAVVSMGLRFRWQRPQDAKDSSSLAYLVCSTGCRLNGEAKRSALTGKKARRRRSQRTRTRARPSRCICDLVAAAACSGNGLFARHQDPVHTKVWRCSDDRIIDWRTPLVLQRWGTSCIYRTNGAAVGSSRGAVRTTQTRWRGADLQLRKQAEFRELLQDCMRERAIRRTAVAHNGSLILCRAGNRSAVLVQGGISILASRTSEKVSRLLTSTAGRLIRRD